MNLQTRLRVGSVWVAILAVATGSVLLLGYALAGVMFVLIVALMIRRVLYAITWVTEIGNPEDCRSCFAGKPGLGMLVGPLPERMPSRGIIS